MSQSRFSRFDAVCFTALCAVMALLFVYLFGYNLLFTSHFDPVDPLSEHILHQRDPVLVNLVLTAALLGLFRAVLLLEKRLALKAVTIVTLGLSFSIGCGWVLFCRAIPVNDAGILYYTAAELSRGNVAELSRHATYLRVNPFQAGYLQFSEVLQRLFGRRTYVPQGVIHAAFITAAHGALLALSWQSLRNRRTQIALSFMVLLFVQPFFFSTFLYGLLPGICLSLWALVCVQRWIQGGRPLWLLPAVVLLSLAAVLKINSLIFSIAIASVLMLYALTARRWTALMLAVLMIICPLFSSAASQKLLQRRTGFDFGDSAPQTTWLAMGMQESTKAEGWYNVYPIQTMEAAQGDGERMQEIVNASIRERLSVFAADPGYAASFYHRKMMSQWAEPTFESLLINLSMSNESARPDWVAAILGNASYGPLCQYMKGIVLVIDLGFASALILLAFAIRRHQTDWRAMFAPLVAVVYVLGGFLYHMLFEAKSQYLLPYVMVMLPFAAYAIGWKHSKKTC